MFVSSHAQVSADYDFMGKKWATYALYNLSDETVRDLKVRKVKQLSTSLTCVVKTFLSLDRAEIDVNFCLRIIKLLLILNKSPAQGLSKSCG